MNCNYSEQKAQKDYIQKNHFAFFSKSAISE